VRVAVVGLGAMGSAVAYHLASGGAEVVGFDRYRPPHTLGSSHGESRIIREAYAEGAAYVPLVQRGYELWEALERASGQSLLRITGGLYLEAGGAMAGRARASAEAYDIPYEVLSAAEVRSRFPALRPGNEFEALYEHRAGVLLVERCVEAHLEQAARAGADLRFETPVEGWEATADGVRLTTADGEVEADALVLAAGPWNPSLAAGAGVPLVVERQVMHWFASRSAGSAGAGGDDAPISIWQPAEGPHFYSLPDLGGWGPSAGLKVALHHGGEQTTPDDVSREVTAADIEAVRDVAGRWMPEVSGEPLRSVVCMYTNTPDEDFLIDAHPDHEHVLVVSPCSGHGFKFAAAIGEAVAQRLLDGAPKIDLSPFRRDRPALSA
jgi:sarcosine oxidase